VLIIVAVQTCPWWCRYQRYSGWQRRALVFLSNAMLIIAGSLVGSSGARNVRRNAGAAESLVLQTILGGTSIPARRRLAAPREQRPVKSGSANDAAFILSIIVPGWPGGVARCATLCQEAGSQADGKKASR
jgi:NAD(P) transhydrogenase subunit beta